LLINLSLIQITIHVREAPQKMVPLMNNYGQAVNYQYMMNAETKDTLLERNNRMQDVMGSMAGSIVDKVNTKAHNETAIKALHEQYNEEGFSRPDAFIEISMNSTDPQIREIYQLLPDATKRDIRKVWGREAMMVRVDLVDLFFGYRKIVCRQSLIKTPMNVAQWERSL